MSKFPLDGCVDHCSHYADQQDEIVLAKRRLALLEKIVADQFNRDYENMMQSYRDLYAEHNFFLPEPPK